jgi:hypothetical protein
MSRFVRPETRTLTLANGDQLIVRARLTAGEQRARLARMYPNQEFDRLLVPVAYVLAYLLDWNLTDAAGQAVVIRDLVADDLQRVIDALDQESFTEIFKAIEAHEEGMKAAREAEKKTAGEMPSSPTSLSLVASAGGTNG